MMAVGAMVAAEEGEQEHEHEHEQGAHRKEQKSMRKNCNSKGVQTML